jgi:flavin-dependent dehydrogenase
MNERYEAIIIGGGPAGASAAIVLAQAGWRVAVVEKKAFPRRKVCGEFISETTWPLLRKLGVASDLLPLAGPVVRRVGVFAGAGAVTANLSLPDSAAAASRSGADGGRALGRELLDTALLRRAATVGAEVLQPWALADCVEHEGRYRCRLLEKDSGRARDLSAPLIIAAHGSWESGALATQDFRQPARPGDLFGFKAHFRDCALPDDLMPLFAFPGGYGGMVHSDGGRMSLSCCIRRDQLARCRQRWPQMKAGEAVLAHIQASCAGVADALASASTDDAWLSAGPLRTGIRSFGRDGIFAVGNAAAEAHPIVAEGISMAVQSAYLLCEQLVLAPRGQRPLAQIRRDYEAAWRRNFSRRLQVAALLAQLFMRPLGAAAAIATLQQFPQLLTLGARWSGKLQPLRSVSVITADASLPTRH